MISMPDYNAKPQCKGCAAYKPVIREQTLYAMANNPPVIHVQSIACENETLCDYLQERFTKEASK